MDGKINMSSIFQIQLSSLLHFITNFIFMQFNVPIIVHRSPNYHVEKPAACTIADNNLVQLTYLEKFRQKNKSYQTLEQKKQKVRIRRISSSKSKRKFPKDFFARGNSQPQKINDEKIVMKKECRETKQKTAELLSSLEEKQFETPKFHDKFKQKEGKKDDQKRWKQKSNNNTLNIKQIAPEYPNKNLNLLENTFSQNCFLNTHLSPLQQGLKKNFKMQKENLQRKKLKTPRELHCKKFSLIKQKTGYFRLKNLFQ